jgi:hypothetical protein
MCRYCFEIKGIFNGVFFLFRNMRILLSFISSALYVDLVFFNICHLMQCKCYKPASRLGTCVNEGDYSEKRYTLIEPTTAEPMQNHMD